MGMSYLEDQIYSECLMDMPYVENQDRIHGRTKYSRDGRVNNCVWTRRETGNYVLFHPGIFSGVVDIGVDKPAPDYTGVNYTLQIWMQTFLLQNINMFDRLNNGVGGIRVFLTALGEIGYETHQGAVIQQTLSVPVPYGDDVWHLLTISIDSAGNCKIFYDKTELGLQLSPTHLPASAPTQSSFHIGGRLGIDGYQGYETLPRIWQRALSLDEHSRFYDNEINYLEAF